jgi:hypothetical protein
MQTMSTTIHVRGAGAARICTKEALIITRSSRVRDGLRRRRAKGSGAIAWRPTIPLGIFYV